MIALTDKAATKVSELITAEGDDNLALRVAVRPGGCSGFSYDMFFDTEKAEDETGAETIEIILGVIGAVALAAAIWAGINAFGQGKIGELG